MTLKQMKYFLSVANTGNMTKSAEHLFLSQPALSLAIRELEKETGVELFQKNGNHLVLTEAGETLRDQVSDILQQYDLLQARIRSGSLNKNYVRFGYSTIVGNTAAPEICCQFLRCYPDIRLETTEDYGAALLYKLANNQLDVVITGGRYSSVSQWKDHFNVCLLRHSGMRYFLREDHPLVWRDEVTMEEVAQTPTILLDDTVPISGIIRNEFTLRNLPINVIIRSKDIYMVERFVSLGVGGGFLPPESGSLNSSIRPVNCPELSNLETITTAVYWRKDRMPSWALQQFITVARHLYGDEN